MDEYFLALANVHRRRLLVTLLELESQRDNIAVPEDVRGEENVSEALKTQYHHSHLPRLEEARLIRWDRDTHTVGEGQRFDEIRPLLELMRDSNEESSADWQ